MKSQGHLCATCGFRQLKLPQRTSSGGASHEICPSCGFEPGYTDDDQNISAKEWREQWVAGGCQWFGKGKARPKNWNPIKDLHSLLRRKRPVNPPVIIRRERAEPTAPSAPPPPTPSSPGRLAVKAGRKRA